MSSLKTLLTIQTLNLLRFCSENESVSCLVEIFFFFFKVFNNFLLRKKEEEKKVDLSREFVIFLDGKEIIGSYHCENYKEE